MKQITEQELFSRYPKYSNLEKLKTNDILIMPKFHDNQQGLFYQAQQDFFTLISDIDVSCAFYSEDPKQAYFRIEASAIPADVILEYGALIISSLAGAIKIYEFFKEKTNKHQFRVTHILVNNGTYFEMTEFEGTIEAYKKVYQNMKKMFEKRD